MQPRPQTPAGSAAQPRTLPPSGTPVMRWPQGSPPRQGTPGVQNDGWPVQEKDLIAPQKVLRRRLGPRASAVQQRELELKELIELRDAKEAADAARVAAEAERVRLQELFEEQQVAAWAAKLAEENARRRSEELEQLRLEQLALVAAERAAKGELDVQLRATQEAAEAASKRHASALRSQLDRVERELRDNALTTGRPTNQARWAIGVVQGLVPPPEPQPDPEPEPNLDLAHQPVALASKAKQRAPSPTPAPVPAKKRKKKPKPVPLTEKQVQTVQMKYAGEGGEEKAAAFLQSVVRGANARREAAQRERGARALQAAMRGWQERREDARARSVVANRSKAEHDLFDRMQQLMQRSGLRGRSAGASRPSTATAGPFSPPQPERQLARIPEPEPEQMKAGRPSTLDTSLGYEVEGRLLPRRTRRRRCSRPTTPVQPLAGTFAALQRSPPRSRPHTAEASWSPPTPQPQPHAQLRSTQLDIPRPVTAEASSQFTGRDEVFPDVRFPGGQIRPQTAEIEARKAKQAEIERQRLHSASLAFGAACSSAAKRGERAQRRTVRKWDGSTSLALPKRLHSSKELELASSPFFSFSPQGSPENFGETSLTDDGFSGAELLPDANLEAESGSAMVALGEARGQYEQASVGLPQTNPHTYVVEYDDGSMDIIGGGGVPVGPDEGVVDATTALHSVEAISQQVEAALREEGRRQLAATTPAKVRKRREQDFHVRMWSRNADGWELGNLSHADTSAAMAKQANPLLGEWDQQSQAMTLKGGGGRKNGSIEVMMV